MRTCVFLVLLVASGAIATSVFAQGDPSAAGSSAPGAESVRAAVRNVLSQPEFRHIHADPAAESNWWKEKIDDFFSWIRTWAWGLPGWLLWLLIIWMLLTLVAILVHFVYTISQQFGGGRRVWRTDQRTGRVYNFNRLDLDMVRRAAQQHIEAGNWTMAVRLLYMAAILWLDQRGLVAFREHKTNHDYIRELAPHATVQQEFRTLTSAFDGIVYGGHVPTAEMCQQMKSTFENLQDDADTPDKA